MRVSLLVWTYDERASARVAEEVTGYAIIHRPLILAVIVREADWD